MYEFPDRFEMIGFVLLVIIILLFFERRFAKRILLEYEKSSGLKVTKIFSPKGISTLVGGDYFEDLSRYS